MRLALFIRALVVCVPAAAAQRCEFVEAVQRNDRLHFGTSGETRHGSAQAPVSASCIDGDHGIGCSAQSFAELARDRRPG